MRVGDYGRTLRFQMEDQRGRDEPIDDATGVTVHITRPDGTTFSRVGALGPAVNECEYTLSALDVDQAGSWKAEAEVATPAGPLHSTAFTWRVRPALV